MSAEDEENKIGMTCLWWLILIIVQILLIPGGGR
jgi:hypothetical protein